MFITTGKKIQATPNRGGIKILPHPAPTAFSIAQE
jgi:hypothetical protein